MVRQITLGTAILFSVVAYAQTPPPAAKVHAAPSPKQAAADDLRKPAPAERMRFKLYRTENNWTLLLLDTRDGRIWQLQYAVNDDNRGSIPLSMVRHADGPSERFELVPTKNLWNFILLDQIDGRTWQCQFSVGPQPDSNRGCTAVDAEPKLE